MIVIGIDPGLAHTGWGVVEKKGSHCRARAYGCIDTSAEQPLDQRLGSIFSQLVHIVLRYEPSCAAVEKIFFGHNMKSAIATAHARGAALIACSAQGCAVKEYTPLQIKQSVVGIGSADKVQVTYMVRRILKLDHDPRPDHSADALAAALCCVNTMHLFADVLPAYKEGASR